MTQKNARRHPALTGLAATLLLLSLAGCQEKTDAPAPAAAVPATADAAASPASTQGAEHNGDARQTPEEARAQGHREGMEMERDAHERGMEMGAKSHADGMKAGSDDAMPMKKADPPMKMDGHM